MFSVPGQNSYSQAYPSEKFPKELAPSFYENLSRACGYKAERTWAEYSMNPLSKSFWVGCTEGIAAARTLFFKDVQSRMNYEAEGEEGNGCLHFEGDGVEYTQQCDWQESLESNPPPTFSENLFRACGYKAKRTWSDYPINPLSKKFWEGCAEARQAASDLFPKRTLFRIDRSRLIVPSWKDPKNLLSRHSTWAVFIRVLGWDSKRTVAGWFCSFNPYSELHTKGSHLDSMKELSARTRDSILRGMGYDVKSPPARYEQGNRVPAFHASAGAGWGSQGYNRYHGISQGQDYNSDDDVDSSKDLPGKEAISSRGGFDLENVRRVNSTGSGSGSEETGDESRRTVRGMSFSVKASSKLLNQQRTKALALEAEIKELREQVKYLEGLLRNSQHISNVTSRRGSWRFGAGVLSTDVVDDETA